jgi:hypothetical protein
MGLTEAPPQCGVDSSSFQLALSTQEPPLFRTVSENIKRDQVFFIRFSLEATYPTLLKSLYIPLELTYHFAICPFPECPGSDSIVPP